MAEPLLILRLHRGWGYLTSAEGVEVWSFANQKRFRIKGPAAALTRLLAALRDGVPAENSTAALAEAAGIRPQQVEKLVHQLRRLGAVLRATAEDEKITKAPERALYDPQVEHFSFWEREGVSGRDMDQRLRQRRVVLVGLGGYGCWIALLLSRIGIRHIIAIDPDHVEASNLSRQILYSRTDTGKLKRMRRLRRQCPSLPLLPFWKRHASCPAAQNRAH